MLLLLLRSTVGVVKPVCCCCCGFGELGTISPQMVKITTLDLSKNYLSVLPVEVSLLTDSHQLCYKVPCSSKQPALILAPPQPRAFAEGLMHKLARDLIAPRMTCNTLLLFVRSIFYRVP